LLFWYSATVEGIAHHVCDGPHIGCAPVTADTSKPSIYTYKPALLIIKITPRQPVRAAVRKAWPSSSVIAVTLRFCRQFSCLQPVSIAPWRRTGWAMPLAGSRLPGRAHARGSAGRRIRSARPHAPPNPKFAGADQGHAGRGASDAANLAVRAHAVDAKTAVAREKNVNHCGAARGRSAARRDEARHAGGRRARRARDQRLKNPPKRTGTRRVPQWPGAPSNTPVSAAPHCRQAPPWSIFEPEIV
jgi:hypothetical protein